MRYVIVIGILFFVAAVFFLTERAVRNAGEQMKHEKW